MNLLDVINLRFGFVLVGYFLLLPIGGWLAIFLYNAKGLPNPDDYKPSKGHH